MAFFTVFVEMVPNRTTYHILLIKGYFLAKYSFAMEVVTFKINFGY